ncbi:MAG: DUF4328 domain-containing protein [Actinomycetota bacterium]|nr:DUF4328 domain-containing protein [Actinomycetota bacterium]
MDFHPGGRARATRILLFALAGMSALAAVSDALAIEVLGRLKAGEDVPDAQLAFNDAHQAVVGGIQAIVGLALIVVFLMWFFRAYRNLPRLGVRTLRHKPGWAVGGWLVPILNLWRPKEIANDIWRGSDPHLPAQAGRAWQNRSPGPCLAGGGAVS